MENTHTNTQVVENLLSNHPTLNRVPTDLGSQGIEVGQGKSGIFFVGQGNV